MKFESMCTGPNSDQVKLHKEKLEFHGLMHNFYKMRQEDQLVFMAMFNQMGKNSEDKTPR